MKSWSPTWNSVKETLPNEEQLCLVFWRDGRTLNQATAKFIGHKWLHGTTELLLDKVTHWVNFPEQLYKTNPIITRLPNQHG